ncbi:MipA/OmpV family protein [Cysteiniphilum sp. 6C5]|uniref:MipA/OmpV family protein n=1 Tax=unclassified Cysteiniphilum TaxID=2610889 RepID=UPI003F82BC49
MLYCFDDICSTPRVSSGKLIGCIMVFFLLITVGVSGENSDNEKMMSQVSAQSRQYTSEVLSVGIGGIVTPNPYLNTEPTILPIPFIQYQDGGFNFVGTYGSYALYQQGSMVTLLEGFLYPEVYKASKSSNARMQQLDKRNYIVMAGMSQQLLTPYGRLNLSIDFDITGKSNGFMSTLGYKNLLNYQLNQHALQLSFGGGVQYSSSQLLNYYYGVSCKEMLVSGLSEYAPDAALSPFLSFGFKYTFKQKWSAAFNARLNILPTEVTNSPMISEYYVLTSSLVLSYRFI